MFKSLEFFMMVDLMFLLEGGGATDMLVVKGGAASIEGRGAGMFVFVFEVEVDGITNLRP